MLQFYYSRTKFEPAAPRPYGLEQSIWTPSTRGGGGIVGVSGYTSKNEDSKFNDSYIADSMMGTHYPYYDTQTRRNTFRNKAMTRGVSGVSVHNNNNNNNNNNYNNNNYSYGNTLNGNTGLNGNGNRYSQPDLTPRTMDDLVVKLNLHVLCCFFFFDVVVWDFRLFGVFAVFFMCYIVVCFVFFPFLLVFL